jgi:hypothetical protein
MFGVSDMGLSANFKIRTKIIIALLPLTIMVIVAVLYSSDRMSTIDAGYSGLIDKDINALQDLTFAQSLNNLGEVQICQNKRIPSRALPSPVSRSRQPTF